MTKQTKERTRTKPRAPASKTLGIPIGEAMKSKKLLSPLAFLLGLTASSCAGPPQPAPIPPVMPVATQTPTHASRDAARAVDLLTKLLAIDRKAVEISEARFANVRDLANAGRLGEADVLSAELELLKLRQQLLLREQELADAQPAAAPDVPPSRLAERHRR